MQLLPYDVPGAVESSAHRVTVLILGPFSRELALHGRADPGPQSRIASRRSLIARIADQFREQVR